MKGGHRLCWGLLWILMASQPGPATGRRQSKSKLARMSKQPVWHLVCRPGMFKDPHGCLPCRNCTMVSRHFRVHCNTRGNAECGTCLDDFHDDHTKRAGARIKPMLLPCQHCQFDQTNATECESFRARLEERMKMKPKRKMSDGTTIPEIAHKESASGPQTTIVLEALGCLVLGAVIVFVVVVGMVVSVVIASRLKKERYSENTGSAGISTPSTDDRLLSATDDTSDDIQPLLSNVHGSENTVPDSGSSRNTLLHQPPSTSAGEMANQCSRMPSVNPRVNRESAVRSGEPSIGEGETESFGAELPKAPRSNDKKDLLVSINTSDTTNVPDSGNLILLEDLMPDLYNDEPPQTATVFPREDEIAAASPTSRELPNTCCRPALKRSASCPTDTSAVTVHQQEWGAAEAVILAGQKQLKVVSECLGVSYIARLLRELKLPEADAKLDNLKHQNMDGEELVYQSLLSWKRWAGDMATVTRLVSALEAIHRRDVSGKL